jgi:hypothetical protein
MARGTFKLGGTTQLCLVCFWRSKQRTAIEQQPMKMAVSAESPLYDTQSSAPFSLLTIGTLMEQNLFSRSMFLQCFLFMPNLHLMALSKAVSMI